MKKILIPFIFFTFFLISCSSDEYNPNVTGKWEQSYSSLEEITGKFEQRTIILDKNNVGKVIDVLLSSDDYNYSDTLRTYNITSVSFLNINDHKVMYMQTDSTKKEISYVIHKISSNRMELINNGKYYDFIKK